MVTRRKLVATLGVSAFAPLPAFSQQPSTRFARIGTFNVAAAGGVWLARQQAFRDGMRDFGYVEGRNLQFEVRWADGKLERLPALAAEMVALKVDVILVGGSAAADAARRASKTIPIVMAMSSDPVGDGHAISLARPGGNMTGLSAMSPEMGAKRIQLLKETFPQLSRTLAVMWNPAQTGLRARFDQARVAGPKLGLGVQSIEVRDLDEIEKAFEAMGKQLPEALVLIADPFTTSQRKRIIEFAAAKRLPAIYDTSDFVENGGLMSYGPDPLALYRRAAYYVDRILKGANPGELPIEQPTTFEFVINVRTAKALGIKLPQTVLLQATRVIE